VVKLDVDRNPRTAQGYGVRSIPTMILFRGPLQVDQLVGAMSKSALDARLDRSI
jgi:thioredoxin 1